MFSADAAQGGAGRGGAGRGERPYLVLTQQEGQQHQHPPIVDDPPHVDVALGTRLAVAGEEGDVFGHQQCQVGGSGHSHRVYEKKSRQVEFKEQSSTLEIPACIHGTKDQRENDNVKM